MLDKLNTSLVHNTCTYIKFDGSLHQTPTNECKVRVLSEGMGGWVVGFVRGVGVIVAATEKYKIVDLRMCLISEMGRHSDNV